MPSLLIAGAQKCGTSTLHACLTAHPDVQAAISPDTGKEVKEIDFFMDHWSRGIDWYQSHFTDPDRKGIDATPNMICSPLAHSRMAALIPDARIIVTLRDPVARAFSQFNHYTQELDESRDWDWLLPGASFADNIQAEFETTRASWYGILNRGMYLQQIDSLLRHFPRSQIHLMVMEQWNADPQQHFDTMLQFLGLEPQRLPTIVSHMRPYTVPPLDSPTAEILRQRYRPHNEALFEFMGQSIDQWE
ncbi:Sulfotransferase domain protein [Rubripirellula lacrimiformis]|uniref:Sulfotransferase domain protein n=2 Tax=Rubripirellula lacrimiformis TaxID=1930273 RepID=A0A517N6N0_9BACT|nr:Sulfotransferase domain protein [Rubripirellula lacrimiformis]